MYLFKKNLSLGFEMFFFLDLDTFHSCMNPVYVNILVNFFRFNTVFYDNKRACVCL